MIFCTGVVLIAMGLVLLISMGALIYLLVAPKLILKRLTKESIMIELDRGDSIQGTLYKTTRTHLFLVDARTFDSNGVGLSLVGVLACPKSRIVYIQGTIPRS